MMDDCFQERLVYSESDGSEVDEPTEQIAEKSTPQLSEVNSSPNEDSNDIANSNENHILEESDEENLNKSIKRAKKSARVLSSDDENGNEVSDDESHVNQKETQLSDNEPMEESPKVSVRPSICDSDTKSSDNGNKSDEESHPPESVKKIKKKKNKLHKRLLATGNESDSDSNNELTEKPDKAKKKQKKQKKSSKRSDQSNSSGSSKTGSGSSSSSASDSGSKSDSNSSTHSNDQSNTETILKPREKTAQRMSAKMAEHQMKEIQSESQRLARQLHVSIPYHKPKQHSLKEFLSRRSIIEHQEKISTKPMPKAAVAIKMSGDELIQFMEHMNKRAKEAEEFFQDEEEEPEIHHTKSDGSEDEDWTDKSKVEKEKPTEMPEKITQIDFNECQESETQMDMDNPEMMLENAGEKVNGLDIEKSSEEIVSTKEVEISETMESNEPQESTSTEVTKTIEIHTERTELDDELDAMLANDRRKEKLKLCIPTDHVPKLKGDKGLVIDFETNDLKPVPKSGVDELLNRFMKNACVKTTTAEQHDVGIFQNDTGTVERHKFHVNLDDKPRREPKPGESLFKLRSELSQKIKENREKQIAQRLQEEKQQKLLDNEENEEDEEELCEEEQEMEMCEEEQETEIPKEVNQQMDLEAADEEQSEQNDDVDAEDSECENSDDENQSNDEAAVDLDVTEVSKRRRILVMDDSDDESTEPSPINAIENEGNEAVSQQPDQSFDDTSKAMTSHDLSALESEILQLDSQINTELNKSETTKLFQDSNNEYGDISESQLMALCSGSFVTQHPDKPSSINVEPTQNENTEQVAAQIEVPKESSQGKPAFLSSDEEETEKDESTKVKKKQKKQKKQTLVYSDDEDDQDLATATEEQDEFGEEEEDEEQIEDEEEDIGERYIEYDSDENEIEVELKKSDVKNKASEYLENEAELSESEWGNDDEEEKDELNQYEAELGDLEQFDKDKLRDELERIRLREQIDDDARALRILKERFIEEEDNGMERERKFRWKHLNNGDNDDQAQNADPDAIGEQNNSDDENEAEWRRIRYEREQLLKQQTNGNDTNVERTTVAMEVVEHKSVGNTTSIFNSRRISIIKPVNNASAKTSSPFLITKSDLNMSHLSRKSFLNRDSPILEKLAGLSKTGSDGETILNTAKGKGNYVFIATEKKDTSKRKSESENGAMPGATNPSKKSKLDLPKSTLLRPQTKAFFESLK